MSEAKLVLNINTVDPIMSALSAESPGLIGFNNLKMESISEDTYRVRVDLFIDKKNVNVLRLDLAV